MDLECNPKIGSKVKHHALVVVVKLKDETQTSATQRDHTCGLVIGLGNVLLEVIIVVNQCLLIFFGQILFLVLEVSFGLN